MYISRSQKKIVAAILFGTAVIALALLLQRKPTTLSDLTVVNGEAVVVTAAPARKAIAIADSNADGVPDWQESLQVTAALSVDTATSTFMPPNTLTDKFALEFFEQMVRNENYGEFGKTPDELVATFSTSLANEAVDEIITLDKIVTTADNSPASLAAYGEAVAKIILKDGGTPAESEVVILERALRDNNPEELAKLDAKIDMYSDILKETLVISVPSSVSSEHLLLVNAYQAILADLLGMRNAFADPMLALLRMKRYQEDVVGAEISLEDIYNKLYDNGARWPLTSPVMSLIVIEP